MTTYALACQCKDCSHWEVLATESGFSGGAFWHHPKATLRCMSCGRLFAVKITVDPHAHLMEMPLTTEQEAARPSTVDVAAADDAAPAVIIASSIVPESPLLDIVETAVLIEALHEEDGLPTTPVDAFVPDVSPMSEPVVDDFRGGESGGGGGGADFSGGGDFSSGGGDN